MSCLSGGEEGWVSRNEHSIQGSHPSIPPPGSSPAVERADVFLSSEHRGGWQGWDRLLCW